jgi:hypothetical protein
MKKQIILILFILLNAWCSNISAQPKKEWQDTPTPAEIAVHNQPYIILQNEIENKLCDKDWEINSKYQFLVLKGGDNEDVILRGTTVHYFTPVDRGVLCEIDMKYGSAKYKANTDSFNAQMKMLGKGLAVSANANLEMAQLQDERQLATIKLQLNSEYTDDLTDANNDYHFYIGAELSTVPAGIQMATLFKKDNAKASKDTLYYAVLYIGDWTKSSSVKKREFFHFVHYTKEPWTDKQHSGTPFLENMKITIQTYSYEKLMKVINGIDWTKLKALIKK